MSSTLERPPSPRRMYVNSWLRCTRPLLMSSSLSVSRPNSVAAKPPVSHLSTTPSITAKSSSHFTVLSAKDLPRLRRSHPANKERNVRTDKRSTVVLPRQRLEPLARNKYLYFFCHLAVTVLFRFLLYDGSNKFYFLLYILLCEDIYSAVVFQLEI